MVTTENDAVFPLLQSEIHWSWVRAYSSTLGGVTINYAPTDCLGTFPFPALLNSLEALGKRYHTHRQQIMLTRQEGLTKTYNRFHDPEEASDDIRNLRELHVEMDRAVADAYGWTELNLGHGFHETKQGVRYTISEAARREVLARLLTLNHERYAEEVEKGLHDTKKPKSAAKPKPTPAKAVKRLFSDDDATFPGTERDDYLCGLVCDLVAADPGLPVSAYVDSLVIALGHERHKRLLTGRDATNFERLCKATPLAAWSATDKIPWAELVSLLHQRKAVEPDGQTLRPGPQWAEVRPSYQGAAPELVALLRKAAAELRNLQAQADPQKAEILRAFAEDKQQWFGVAA